jgi:mono/diheme cytochrome c family protein
MSLFFNGRSLGHSIALRDASPLNGQEVSMYKVLSLALLVGAGAFALELKRVEIQPTPASSGEAMYKAYCAACHGAAGKGDGPATSALKKRPADLTQLARKNNGRFPAAEVMTYINGGTHEMPVWGTLFRSLEPDKEAVSTIRVRVLEEYIKTLQAQ